MVVADGDRIMQDTLAVILAGGRGERLEPLTRDRAKPAVPFGGTYRIIDFHAVQLPEQRLSPDAAADAVQVHESGPAHQLGLAAVLSAANLGEFIDVVPPQQRIYAHWYQGTADAVYQNIYTIEKERPEYIVILAGDHIYKMDYGTMVQYHKDTRGRSDHRRLAGDEGGSQAVRRDADGHQQSRVIGFEEKPERSQDDPRHTDALPGVDGHLRVPGAIPVRAVSWKTPISQDSTHDFGRDIIPSIIHSHQRVRISFRGPGRATATPTGGTWGRWMPTTRPIWIWSPSSPN